VVFRFSSHVRCASKAKWICIATSDSQACASANSESRSTALDRWPGRSAACPLSGVALAQARHELIVRFRIAAVAVAHFGQPVETDCAVTHDASSNFVLYLKHVFQFEVVFLGQRDLVCLGIDS